MIDPSSRPDVKAIKAELQRLMRHYRAKYKAKSLTETDKGHMRQLVGIMKTLERLDGLTKRPTKRR